MSARDVINAACINLNDNCDSTYATVVINALTASGHRILGPDDAARLTTQLAQLRHAYTHLNAGRVTDQRQFANGLIHPAIAALEEALCATQQGDK